MAEFEVPIVRITKVEDHPNADRLSLNYFNEYITISAKLEDGSHRYQAGDLVVYVPEGAVVPEALLRKGFWDEKNDKGILSGSKGNRVSAKRLRNILSQGIMFSVNTFDGFDPEKHFAFMYDFPDAPVYEGMDVSISLSITKYEPEIPASMAGEVIYIGDQNVLKFDVENIKKYPNILIEGELVEITEKLHGTMMGIGFVPGLDVGEGELWIDRYANDSLFCYSKGLGKQGLVFKNNDQNALKNVYVKIMNSLHDQLSFMAYNESTDGSVYFLGEVAGQDIQDLGYGFVKPEFRLFDVAFVTKDGVNWQDRTEVEKWAEFLGVETVPLLYRGPWNPKLRQLRDGKSTLADHIREGIVIRADRNVDGFGRVILKDVSDDYLMRKNGTELS
jgi:RNA ligase (TIGR02306 family)